MTCSWDLKTAHSARTKPLPPGFLDRGPGFKRVRVGAELLHHVRAGARFAHQKTVHLDTINKKVSVSRNVYE